MSRGGDAGDVENPTPADSQAIGHLLAHTFREKNVPLLCGCCPEFLLSETAKGATKVYDKYQREYPAKMQHCGIIRGVDEEVLSICQLQLAGDPGNLMFSEQHRLLSGEAYIECIGTDVAAQGKGHGSKLLAWASETAAKSGAKYLSLEVMGGNPRARALYERKGFVRVKPDPHDDDPMEAYCAMPFIFCFLGCRYCSVQYMENRNLPEVAMPVATARMAPAAPASMPFAVARPSAV